MRVFVTGATGFVGTRLVGELLRRGHHPVCLLRRGGQTLPASNVHPGLETIVGELSAARAHPDDPIGRVLKTCQIVVHLASSWNKSSWGLPPTARAAADLAGIKALASLCALPPPTPVVALSALGAHEDSHSPFLRNKALAERTLREGGRFPVVAVRSSLVFGSQDRFVSGLQALMRRVSFTAQGEGQRLRAQPIFVDDLAAGLVGLSESLVNETGQMKAWSVVEAGGPDVLSLGDLLDLIRAAQGIAVPRWAIPYPQLRFFLRTASRFGYRGLHPLVLPLLESGACCAVDAFVSFSGKRLLPFGPVIRRFVDTI